jgi:hypothetical protein
MSLILIESPEFTSAVPAYEWRDRYLLDYNPAGYGTRLHVKVTRPGHYIVVGDRWESCD